MPAQPGILPRRRVPLARSAQASALAFAWALLAPGCSRDAGERGAGAAVGSGRAAASAAPTDDASPSRGRGLGAEGAGSARPASLGYRAEDGAAPARPSPGMIAIPEGVFLMGSRETAGDPEERPMHEVAVAAFELDRTEVTTEAYAACVTAGACDVPHDDKLFCNFGRKDRGAHPINCVTFFEAERFCAFAGKRLPTEEEWEYAASGGGEQRKYSWGDEPADKTRACFMHPGTCAVGSYAPGAFGLVDMSGNVWEWTASYFGPYPGPSPSGRYRVYRGGSWSRRFSKWLRNAIRNRYRPEEQSASLGFRCARSVSPLACPDETEPRGGRCVRVRGVPRCAPSTAWDGAACSLDGLRRALEGLPPPPPLSGPLPSPPSSPPPEKRAGEAAARLPGESPPPAPPAPIVRTRTPEHDGDCSKTFPGTRAAYRYAGGTFEGRNPLLAASGCVKRDMGNGWTSACCPE